MFSRFKRRLLRRPRLSLALAGGGCKAFFALGVGHVLLRAGLPLRRIAGASAGSAMAMCLLSDSARESVRYFCAISRRNPANFHWDRLLRGRRPWPHERMYRSTILSYTDLARVQASPIELAVNALRVPPQHRGLASTKTGDRGRSPGNNWPRYQLMRRIITAYRREIRYAAQGVYRPVMRGVAAELGLEERVYTKADLNSMQAVADIVLASSSIWPLLDFQQWSDGELYLDGGITNNLAVHLLPREDLAVAVHYDDRRMTRYFYEQTGDDVGRSLYYISPDEPLPIAALAYANADGELETFELGLKSGERHLPRIEALLR